MEVRTWHGAGDVDSGEAVAIGTKEVPTVASDEEVGVVYGSVTFPTDESGVSDAVEGQNRSHFEPKPVPPPFPNKCDWEVDPSELDLSNSGSFGEILKAHWRGTPVSMKRFESPGKWEDHHRIFGVDGPEIHYPGAQNESFPYVYYTPSYGYSQSSYNPSSYNPHNPYIPGAMMGIDVPFGGAQPYYSLPNYQNHVSSPSFIPFVPPKNFLLLIH